MHPSLIFRPGAPLSLPELRSARLDGLLIEVGEGYMPPDLPEDEAARLLSLGPLLAPGYAACGPTAAWVHGVGDLPPNRHHVQRVSDKRARVRPIRNVIVHERRLDDDDIVVIAGVPVTTRLRTMTDLVLSADRDTESARWMRRLARADPWLVPQVREMIEARHRLPGRRAALAALASLTTCEDEAPQEDVTR